MKKLLFILFLVLISSLTFSCKKEVTGCFNQEMYDTHNGGICPDNCLGVIGCDGNTYCSECDANRSGIAVE
ncbi:MAG: hypothetical protein WAT43_09460 [Chitinophagales bacterium]